jgi:murein L,D-transpeptidase YcbB/YkuD
MSPRSPLFLLALLLAPTLAASQPAPALSRQDATTLVEMLRGAESQGFGSREFDLGGAEAQLGSPDPAVRAAAEAKLRSAAIAYASAQHGQRIAPGAFPSNWAIRPARYDATADFASSLAQNRISAWAASLPPADPRYGELVSAYARYRAIAAHGGWSPIPKGAALKLGATGDRVTALRARLAVEDAGVAPRPPPAPGAAPAPDVYDKPLADAVSRAQARYGLTPDGAAGAATLLALNVPIETRLGQFQANLERLRWLPRKLPPLRIELNIADPSLEVFDGDKPALGMKAIVGKPNKQTPMFQDEVEAIVFNPPWNVPHDIAVKEIWPKIRKDPGYMAREGFVVKPNGELQQLPGPKCALGTIKFDLPNKFGVYLHDTPSHSLFARDSRALSHGCMRLEQPNELAKRLLQGVPDWEGWRVDGVIASGVTQRVELPKHVPVFVLYRSVFVDAQGQVDFRPDVYRWDAQLLALL